MTRQGGGLTTRGGVAPQLLPKTNEWHQVLEKLHYDKAPSVLSLLWLGWLIYTLSTERAARGRAGMDGWVGMQAACGRLGGGLHAGRVERRSGVGGDNDEGSLRWS